jgi:antitoxin component HigA of HigAB toxin-antitoxin module
MGRRKINVVKEGNMNVDENANDSVPADANNEARFQKAAHEYAKRESNKLKKEMAEMFAAQLAQMKSELMESSPAPSQSPGAVSEVETLRAELEKYKRETAKLNQAFESERAALKEKEIRAFQEKRDADTRASLISEFTKLGVRPALVEGAVSLHFPKVKYTEDGEAIYPVKRDTGAVELPVQSAIAEWAKSESGKEWLAPVDASGSGSQRVRSAPSAKSGNSDADKAAAVAYLFGGAPTE